MRDLKREGAVVHAVDLSQPRQITDLVQRVLADHSRIDLLVNNSGYGAYGSVEELPMSEARTQIEVNLPSSRDRQGDCAGRHRAASQNPRCGADIGHRDAVSPPHAE